MLSWSSTNDVIFDVQFGFQLGRGTVDVIFSLRLLLQSFSPQTRSYIAHLLTLKRLLTSLIVSQKLVCKRIKTGVKEKQRTFFIYSLCHNVLSCVNINGYISEYLPNNLGLLQGEVLSPIVFSLVINDFETYFVKISPCFYCCMQMILVISSESVNGLQQMLNRLYEYSNQWGMQVNIENQK